MNILIADDEPVSRRLLEILLNKWGYEVTVASDGDEAWRELQNCDRPRIAILDWMMPGMDGVQLCEKIRGQEALSYTYVILLTARQACLDVNGRYESFADDYLSKPFAAQELRARLRAARRIIELEDGLQAARDALKIETAQDLLTGLWNRSAILEIIQHELVRAKRQNLSLAVFLIDIDQLKKIYHQHGHPSGDAIMREVARRIRSSIRIYDSMGRYGEEQFIVVSPDCDEARALSQGHRIRSVICGNTINTFEGSFPIVINLGIAVGCNHHQMHDLILAADSALAEAKDSGGIRVELAP